MKSKLNDADLIAEAYTTVQEEGLGALAAGAGKVAKKTAKIKKSEDAEGRWVGGRPPREEPESKSASSDRWVGGIPPKIEDAEHAAPEEVDMSENPAPESLEVSKEIEEPEVPASLAIVAPSIQPSVEAERVNHEDDSEMQMAKAELYKLEKYSFKLQQMLDHVPALEGWTASKITKAADYLSSVYHKLDYDLHGNEGGICSEDHEGH